MRAEGRIKRLEHAMRAEPLLDRIGGGGGPIAPGQVMRVRRIDEQFGIAFGVGGHRQGEIPHRGNVLGQRGLIGVFGGRAQDQPEMVGGRGHFLMRDFQQAIPFRVILDRARDVEAARLGRDDGIAALEKKPRGDGRGLAALADPGHLHQQRLTGGQSLGLAQESRDPVGHAQHHAALPLHGPVADRAQDRTGLRRRVLGRVDADILKPPIHHQRGGGAAVEMIQNDDTAFHGCPQTGQPAAARSCAVSASGNPMMAE